MDEYDEVLNTVYRIGAEQERKIERFGELIASDDQFESAVNFADMSETHRHEFTLAAIGHYLNMINDRPFSDEEAKAIGYKVLTWIVATIEDEMERSE